MPTGTIGPDRPWLDPTVEEHRGRFYGRYAGYVRDRSDPTKTGRVKVYVPAILGDEDKKSSWLDWCLPASPGLSVPPMGAAVWVTFENGQVQHGVYEWGWLTGETAAQSAAPKAGKGEADPTWKAAVTKASAGFGPAITATIPADTAIAVPPVYPYNKVYESEGGHTIELDDSPGAQRGRFRHPSGTEIRVEPNGSVHILSAGAVFEHVVGDRVIMLSPGASFKVIYPDGSSLVLGGSGFHVTGHAASILGRTIQPTKDSE